MKFALISYRIFAIGAIFLLIATQIFDVTNDIPSGPIDYMSPGWKELIRHASSEVYRLGLELTIHNCAGWSTSGGPWITPEHSMQRVVWSEITEEGPKKKILEFVTFQELPLTAKNFTLAVLKLVKETKFILF
ncbi:MAG: hypothetical protein JW731_00040 [Bacteroidales bacterium]|nr:hypothetical protein [Bacteroidales bacterium]